ncbi:MAG: helix-hairpin-helix domain-containing protein [Longimicrobiales bacterium]|nr:helix-hairpin-helix domain-containing protein [Longimicrobiales bacterium]
MTPEERHAWTRMLVVLAVAAGVRSVWQQRTVVPAPGVERDVAAAVDTVRALRADADRRATPLEAGERIDPNRADAAEMDRLPGIGPATARAIVAARAEAPFRTVADLGRVRGIGPSTIEKIAPHLALPGGAVPSGLRAPAPESGRGGGGRARAVLGAGGGAPSTVTRIDLNRADSGILETLPGVGPALAQRIVDDRARNGPYTHVDDLVRVSGIGPATLDRLRALVEVR